MNAEAKRIFELQKKLSDETEYADTQWQAVLDREWDAHHCDKVILSDSIEEYQILRFFDIELEPINDIDVLLDTDEKRDWWYNNEDDMQGFVDEFYDGDPDYAYYTHETGEYMQKWINLKTGKVTTLGRIFEKNPNLCDFEADWTLITNNKRNKKTTAFRHTFENSYGSGFYKDIKINPALEKYGYPGIDALDWYKNMSSEEDNNRSNSSKYILEYFENNQWEDYLFTYANGKNTEEQRFKTYGIENIMQSINLEKIYREDFLTACKIAKKHHYEPQDYNLWFDMMKNLLQLHKDIHNPSIVCPKNLKEAHDKWFKRYLKVLDKIRLQEDLQKAIQENETYIKLCKKFLNIVLQNKNMVIKPFQNVTEFIEEGNAMHHCVYTNGYYKQANTLILSARDNDNNRLATIELNTQDWEIKQVRACKNNVSPYEKEIRKLITNNINVFKKAKKHRLAS